MYHRNSAAVRPRQRPLSLRSVSPRHRASVAPPPVACPPLSFSATGSGAAGGVAGEGGRETDGRRRTRGTRKRRIRSRSPPSRAHALLDRTGRSLTRPYTHTTSERGREGGRRRARSLIARSFALSWSSVAVGLEAWKHRVSGTAGLAPHRPNPVSEGASPGPLR